MEAFRVLFLPPWNGFSTDEKILRKHVTPGEESLSHLLSLSSCLFSPDTRTGRYKGLTFLAFFDAGGALSNSNTQTEKRGHEKLIRNVHKKNGKPSIPFPPPNESKRTERLRFLVWRRWKKGPHISNSLQDATFSFLACVGRHPKEGGKEAGL